MSPLPTPQQLRYLLALAEHGHFGRAAEACAVTQSTLSAGLLALERQLDAKLLDRSAGKRVVFTPLGHEVLVRARTALAALEAVAESAAQARAPMSGPLRLGVIPTIGPFLLPRLMPALRTAFPRLRLFLREDLTPRLMEGLIANRLDVLLLALPCDCGPAETMAVARDEFVLALPPGNPLAALDRVPVAALAGERMLLLEEGHCLRDQALAACGCDTGRRFRRHQPAHARADGRGWARGHAAAAHCAGRRCGAGGGDRAPAAQGPRRLAHPWPRLAPERAPRGGLPRARPGPRAGVARQFSARLARRFSARARKKS